MEPSVHYRTDVPPLGDEPAPDDVATGIDGHVQAALRAVLNAPDIYEGTLVREMVLPPAIGVAGFHANGSTGNLVGGNDQLPRGIVPILNVHSATSSRSSRGHLCGPSPGRDNVFGTTRLWSTTYQALLEAFAELLEDTLSLGSVTPTNLIPCVYSRTRHVRATPPFTFDVTEVSVNPNPHWLRSRTTSP
jgi:hypothetical protein